MKAIGAYIKICDELADLNRYFIGRIEDLKTVHVALLNAAESTDFIGAYTKMDDAKLRCERKAGQPMQWFDNDGWSHAADAPGNGYVIIRTCVNADYTRL